MTPDEMRRAEEIFERDADRLRRCYSDADGNWLVFYGNFPGKEDYDEYRTLARLLREEADLQGWQPIETAPRDGTEVLLLRQDDGAQYISDGIWLSTGMGRWIWAHGRRQPNYWRPLPPPPQGRAP